jgi:hypothetical protein
MKKIFLIAVLFLAFTASSNGQFYKSLLSKSDFSDSLTKIIVDFKTNFSQIQGQEMALQFEMNVYQSKTTLPNSLHCTIIRSHSKFDTSASWQAILYDGENYNDALKIYKDIFNQLKKSRIITSVNIPASFKGELQKPKESVRFASTSLVLETTDLIYRNFFAQIQLNSTYDGWEVQLNLMNKYLY